MVLAFWHTEYAHYDKRFLSEADLPGAEQGGDASHFPGDAQHRGAGAFDL